MYDEEIGNGSHEQQAWRSAYVTRLVASQQRLQAGNVTYGEASQAPASRGDLLFVAEDYKGGIKMIPP
jgi:hypothetical protein